MTSGFSPPSGDCISTKPLQSNIAYGNFSLVHTLKDLESLGFFVYFGPEALHFTRFLRYVH